MTKSERRTKEFSSGLRILSGKSRDYLRNLTQFLFFIEEPPVFFVKKSDDMPETALAGTVAGKSPQRRISV